MRKWDEKEKNQNYSPPSGMMGKALNFMLWGSLALGATYISLTAMQWAFTAPAIAP